MAQHEDVANKASNEERLMWNPRVACRTLDGTAFILLDSRMVSLNDVGTVIWDCFEHGATLEKVVAEVVEQFETTEIEAAADARAFIGELVERRMLIAESSAGDAANAQQNSGDMGAERSGA